MIIKNNLCLSRHGKLACPDHEHADEKSTNLMIYRCSQGIPVEHNVLDLAVPPTAALLNVEPELASQFVADVWVVHVPVLDATDVLVVQLVVWTCATPALSPLPCAFTCLTHCAWADATRSFLLSSL